MSEKLITVAVLIGNSDDKLAQLTWANFCIALKEAVTDFAEETFFDGGSSWESPRQNACIVFSLKESNLESFRHKLRGLRKFYRQDSVALLVSETEFI